MHNLLSIYELFVTVQLLFVKHTRTEIWAARGRSIQKVLGSGKNIGSESVKRDFVFV